MTFLPIFSIEPIFIDRYIIYKTKASTAALILPKSLTNL